MDVDNLKQYSVVDALRKQLRQGFASLTFEPYIESGFQLDYAEQARPFRIALITLGLLSLFMLIVLDTFLFSLPPKLEQVALPLQLFAIGPSLVVALIAILNPRLRRYSEPALLLAVATLALSCMVMRAVGNTDAFEVPVEYTATAIVAVFFLGRLLLWRLLPLVLVLCIALVLNESMFVMPGVDGWYRIGINLTLICIGAGGAYSFEYVARESWLNRRLLEQLSNQDPLTGLLNRRAFSEVAMRGLRQAVREQKTIGLALLDLDHFKLFNDNYGHQAGDGCLRELADILRRLAKRPLDGCGRYGGEEFVIAWFDADAATIRSLAQGALEEIRALEIEHAYSPVRPILTASMGLVTVVPDVSTTLEQLLNVADETMYQAKSNGRDQVVVQHMRAETLHVSAPFSGSRFQKAGAS